MHELHRALQREQEALLVLVVVAHEGGEHREAALLARDQHEAWLGPDRGPDLGIGPELGEGGGLQGHPVHHEAEAAALPVDVRTEPPQPVEPEAELDLREAGEARLDPGEAEDLLRDALGVDRGQRRVRG
ncbi:MAG: hypothetical protein ACK559_10195, partial [bacterium]